MKEKMSLGGDKLQPSMQGEKILFSLMHPIKKQHPIVIQLVQVQLHAFQLQIRAELWIQIDNQVRSLPKTQADVKPTAAY